MDLGDTSVKWWVREVGERVKRSVCVRVWERVRGKGQRDSVRGWRGEERREK